MRIVLAAPIALGLALAACGETGSADADGDGVISAEEMTAAVADREPMQPGNYQLSMEVLELEDPESSPEELQQARAFFEMMGSMAPPQCMTEEDLNGGMMDIAESMQNGDCEVTSMNSAGSNMNAEMSCQSDGGGTATVTVDSTQTATSSEMTMTAVEAAEGGERRLSMRIGMERTGDCS
ncbi:DUF3617 domain-containing protein [Aurantiacibacter gilvus]|uniref:DUF3617 family protein n=1 Tax=Aurantiacibacter gilvus TaxID=3139141 RepID=A0ABU9IEN4_9SPHN